MFFFWLAQINDDLGMVYCWVCHIDELQWGHVWESVYLKSFECDLVGFHGDMMVMQATIWDFKQQDGDLMGI